MGYFKEQQIEDYPDYTAEMNLVDEEMDPRYFERLKRKEKLAKRKEFKYVKTQLQSR